MLLNACKSKKKNTALKRAYHNVTAHYNGYFNAKMRIDQVAFQNEQNFVDRYDELLPIYKVSNESQAGPTAKGNKGSNQPLDEAIKKASFVVQRHEISKWIDNCYLEIGRAYFFKKDYFTAIESFQYVAGKYKTKPSGNEAYIWLIRCYVQLNKLAQAESVVNVALASETIPKKQLDDLFAAVAHYYIAKKNYSKAIEYLEKSLTTTKKKNTRVRYTYILAQLYEKVDDPSKASITYQKVVKMNPSYEMLFNARINSSRLFQTQSIASKKEIEKSLNKMLKDAKNKEFKDQIYYSLASIYENENNTDKALTYYKLSAGSSINNFPQKGLSYLKAANIYFDDLNYEPAQMYYDSASTFLAKEHPSYDLVMNRKRSLTKLVDNLKIIKREDSLQRIAKMPESERNKLIDRIIKKDKEEKQRKEEEDQRLKESLTNNLANNTNAANPGQAASGSTFYFYNTSAVSLGYSEFLKRYSRRTLEDNWRRSNKETFTSLNNSTEPEIETINSGNAKDEDAANRKKYLSNLPLTENAVNVSVDKMVNAYYNIGQFYREEIINTKESILAYETLLSRFPENKLKAETYYNLYRQYLSVNNQKKSDFFKNKILTEFPNSLFAKVIIDPSYTSEKEAVDKKAQSFYEQLYASYIQGDYTQVISYKNFMDTAYASTSVGPKYSYLYAMSVAKTNGLDALEFALNDLIKNYPSSEVATLARETLQKIAEKKNPALALSKAEEPSPYLIENKASYMVMISTDMKSILKETKIQTSRFNSKQFSLSNLTVNSELIGDELQVILVKSFPDVIKSNEYLAELNKQASDIIKIAKGNYSVSIISEKNYKILQEKKDIKKYLQFYQGNYQINE